MLGTSEHPRMSQTSMSSMSLSSLVLLSRELAKVVKVVAGVEMSERTGVVFLPAFVIFEKLAELMITAVVSPSATCLK